MAVPGSRPSADRRYRHTVSAHELRELLVRARRARLAAQATRAVAVELREWAQGQKTYAALWGAEAAAASTDTGSATAQHTGGPPTPSAMAAPNISGTAVSAPKARPQASFRNTCASERPS